MSTIESYSKIKHSARRPVTWPAPLAPPKRSWRAVLSPKRLLARLRMGFGLEPVSQKWAWDRGLPIHRYYLEKFLDSCRDDIRGHVLEFEADHYARAFGGGNIADLDILHIDGSNDQATIIADLTKPNQVQSDSFDCIICTHVLHVIFELEKAISELHRILKPGGVLLVGASQTAMTGPGLGEMWRFTPEGLQAWLEIAFGAGNVEARGYGNSLTAAGELRGLAAREFTPRELNDHDPRFAVEVCARAVKQASRW